MKRAAAKHRLPKGALNGEERGSYRAAMAATAFVALVATGGVVSAKSAAPSRHLIALEPHTQAPSPVTSTIAPTSTTTTTATTATTAATAKPGARPATTTTRPIPVRRVAAVAPPPVPAG